jgi:catechol 2,3-dioxygenase-like lactoylglutathione lyase family enzyme
MIEKLQSLQKMPDGPEKTRALQKLRENSGVAQRVFVGKNKDKAAIVALSDPQGRPRIQLMVDAQGAARLEFLDEKGAVVHLLPAPASDTGTKKAKS